MQKIRGRAYIQNPITGQAPIGRTAVAGEKVVSVNMATIATTGNADVYAIAPCTGKLVSASFSAVDALAAHDTNYVTFSITNLGQSGGGSTAMLAATDANTTKATGGTLIGANTVRALTLHGTAANTNVTAGDRLQIRVAAAATSANQMTYPVVLLKFTETA